MCANGKRSWSVMSRANEVHDRNPITEEQRLVCPSRVRDDDGSGMLTRVGAALCDRPFNCHISALKTQFAFQSRRHQKGFEQTAALLYRINLHFQRVKVGASNRAPKGETAVKARAAACLVRLSSE